MSLEEVNIALGRCYMTFYGNKMTEVLAMPDSFRRRYLLSGFKEMMKDYGEHFDFLGIGVAKISQMTKMGTMPDMPAMPDMPDMPGMPEPAGGSKEVAR
jgi:hypothetical protein